MAVWPVTGIIGCRTSIELCLTSPPVCARRAANPTASPCNAATARRSRRRGRRWRPADTLRVHVVIAHVGRDAGGIPVVPPEQKRAALANAGASLPQIEDHGRPKPDRNFDGRNDHVMPPRNPGWSARIETPPG